MVDLDDARFSRRLEEMDFSETRSRSRVFRRERRVFSSEVGRVEVVLEVGWEDVGVRGRGRGAIGWVWVWV